MSNWQMLLSATMTSEARDTGTSPASFTEFDFVIVGGGLCGLVLAARLSENPNVSVGVLEAGLWKPDDPIVSTPSRILEMFMNPEYQFPAMTVPQKHIGGRRLVCPKGRVLGGGSSVNFMVWNRASKRDYDSFEALGNPGWNFDTITQAGRKSETFHPADTDEQKTVAFTDPSFHGTNGPIQTSFSGWVPETKKAFFEVMEKFGLVKNRDWYNGDNTGIHSSTSSMDPRNGKRSSSATAYFEPNASRPNLSVLCDAHASKVELELKGELVVATGVHYVVKGQTYYVKARKEVIISAGALNTPHVLERSGVGNPSILTPLGIDIKVINPNVGENLQDHMMLEMTYLTKPDQVTQDALLEPDSDFAKAAAAKYAAPSTNQDHGPLAGTFDVELYLPVKTFVPASDLKEMERKLYEETSSRASNAGIKYQLEYLYERGSMEWIYIQRRLGSSTPVEPGRSYIGLMAAIQHPFSRGNTHISSADPAADPETDPRYFEISWDKSLMVHGLEQIDKASRTEPLASLLECRVDPAPGDNSRSVYEDHLEKNVGAGIHWVGTAAMLPEDKGGVVDPKCKVYGTTNLRVVDASIIPLHISAHPQATLYACAERVAEIIIADT